jgi:CheY-like chemotaxis protein
MPSSVDLEPPSGVVLCIDDNQDVLECEKTFLESFGYTVLTAPSGSRGLELASLQSIDVAIVDYFMPEMNGHQVAIEMRRFMPQAPIIMLSAARDIPEQVLKSVDALYPKIDWPASSCSRSRNCTDADRSHHILMKRDGRGRAKLTCRESIQS